MDTAVISYRVADFLKKYPPFNAIADADLLALASRGRVRFHEPHEYVLWQGEPHRYQVFVIQQGTVSLWDDTGGRSELRDVRGAGDMLGLERYSDARSSLYTARSESDVVIYAFPVEDFDAHVLKYPHGAQYVAAERRVTTEYQGGATRREAHRTFLHAAASPQAPLTSRLDDRVADVVARMLAARVDAVAVLDDADGIRALVTGETILGWVAAGAGNARTQAIGDVLSEPPLVVGPDASVSDGILAISSASAGALAITTDGTPSGQIQALVSSPDLSRFFGEQPAGILRDIGLARSTRELRDLNQRARAFIVECLTGAPAVEWLARLAHLVDSAIVTRLVSLVGDGLAPGCWCFFGSSGRGESLTQRAPRLAVIVSDDEDVKAAGDWYQRVGDAFSECGYLPRTMAFESPFYVAPVSEWQARYRDWIRDPVIQQVYRARTLFDLRPVLGRRELWAEIESVVRESSGRDFLSVLANDCLASLPPMTFYEDAVIDSVGEHESTFRLEESALRPLVDASRVFGMAGGAVLGRSTLERFETARMRLPEYEAIFREAADTFRVVLWQQGRVGISQGTSGAELPPSLLSRHDRHILKGGFRSILRLLQFTANRDWLDKL